MTDGWTTDREPAGRLENIMPALPIVGRGKKMKPKNTTCSLLYFYSIETVYHF